MSQRRAVRIIRAALALLVALTLGVITGGRAPSARAAILWEPAGALAHGRTAATATLLPDGRVLVVGGLKGGPYSNSATADLYDAATNSWGATGPLTTPRAGHTATTLPDGGVLVAGGENPFCCGGIAAAERFDPATKTWRAVASMGSPRRGHTATLLNSGKVLVVGGSGASNSPSVPIPTYATTELYDPIANTWTPAAPLPAARVGHTATRLPDGQVLVVGGSTSGAALRYDPAANSWMSAGALPVSPIGGHTATALQDGQVLVFGGAMVMAQRYNPASNAWTVAGTPSSARAGHTATLLTTGDLLLVGGSNASGTLATVDRYNPAKNTWTASSGMAAARKDHAAALVVGKVLVAGGTGAGGTPLASAEIYDDGPPGTCFSETGRCLSGRFLEYWAAHGGLAINGYPLSEVFAEQLADGTVYRVQYFERVRLEYHGENPPPYDVLLGQFGRQIHPAEPSVPALGGARYFPPTGHNLAGDFRAYWEANGGLDGFGYPLTEELTETLEDGRPYTVQYFERARFERHPENPATFSVLLGQFGRRILGGR